MENELNNIILNEDDNARDEFSARDFFNAKRLKLYDITNVNFQTNLSNKHICNVSRSILNNQKNSVNTLVLEPIDEIEKKTTNVCSEQLPKSSSEVPKELSEPTTVSTNILSEVALIVPLYRSRLNMDFVSIKAPLLDYLSELNRENEKTQEFIDALNIPESSHNDKYVKHIAVPVPKKYDKLVKIDRWTEVWNTIMDKANIELRVLSTPCRKLCSPKDEYSLTPVLQYSSHCLIHKYHSNTDDMDTFPKSIAIDGVHKVLLDHPNKSHTFIPESINIAHFYDLYLEKLPCNQIFDFMPQNSELTGSILGTFINGLFELSLCVYVPSEVIHTAVDYIYQYLSRVKDVPLNDMRLLTLGALWVASKYEGFQWLRDICRFTDCSPIHLKYAELRLLTAIDCNVPKPNAISFRNRYIVIELSTSIISLLSSFILDMTLHCYTIMILPASKRAAAALWLSRLIEKFQDIRFNGDEDIHLSNQHFRNIMMSVWPDHFHSLTGYHHSEIAQLAIRMHIVVLAFLCRGQQKNPSVNACYNKYSNDTYKDLTGSYEKFTSQIVYFGTELYCRMNNLVCSEWLEKNEFETLQTRFSYLKPSTRRYKSMPEEESDIVSCPELTSKSIFRHVTSKAEEITVTSDKSKLMKLDSGYSTCSNF